MKTLVIIPTYNESESILSTIDSILSTIGDIEILIVDDDSPDGTGKLVVKNYESDPRVSLLARDEKLGLGPAYVSGFRYALEAGYELLVEMDADGSHQASDLPSLLEAVSEADLVIGSRWIPGGEVLNWPWYRKAISRFGNSYAKIMLGTKIADMTSGFRVFRASFIRKLDLSAVASQGYSFQVELAHKAFQLGKVKEVPIRFIERTAGKSKMTLRIVLEALFNVTKWGIKRIGR